MKPHGERAQPFQRKGAAMTPALIGSYLAAIVAANLTTSHFGPEASIYVAFGMIGLTITTRDKLADLFGVNRVRNMALLILAGSVVSYIAAKSIGIGPPDIVARIALASCIAFAVAESVDAIVYFGVRHRPWLERSNLSNLFGASLDSMIFVSIAFGWTWEIIFLQTCAKLAGGLVFSLLLEHIRGRREVVA